MVISQRNVFHRCVWTSASPWRALLHWESPFPGSSCKLVPGLWMRWFCGTTMILRAPGEYRDCAVCLQKTSVIDRRSHGTKPIFETWTVGANFPSASTQRAGCRTQACWATADSWEKLKFSAGRERGESFNSLVHTSLCSQHGIVLIRALAVSTHLLLSICMAGGLFNSTRQARIHKASNSQHKQQERFRRHGDTSCRLSIKAAFRIHVWHFLGNFPSLIRRVWNVANGSRTSCSTQDRSAVDESVN